jgi:hypothetical protein
VSIRITYRPELWRDRAFDSVSPCIRREHKGSYLYAAAAQGTPAYGKPGEPSVFAQELLAALRQRALVRKGSSDLGSGADTPRWVVTSHSLGDVLRAKAKSLDYQRFWPEPKGDELAFHAPSKVPTATLRVTLRPSENAPRFSIALDPFDADVDETESPFDPHPYMVENLDPGLYKVRLTSTAGLRSAPPRFRAELLPYETFSADFECV